MEPCDDFGFSLGDVKWGAVRLGHARDKIDQEQRQKRNPEPIQQTQTALLRAHNLTEIHAAPGQEHPDQCETHGDLIGDDLRR